jgi:hypothetical protein
MNTQSQKISILFIGAGKWSNKVSEILNEKDSKYVCEVVSSRDFLELNSNSVETAKLFDTFDFIWIATDPKTQLRVLRKVISAKPKIILEKPIAGNKIELEELFDLVTSNPIDVYLSQPWTHSCLWQKILMEIKFDTSKIQLSFIRGGEVTRPYLSPILDWIPHDLYLLASVVNFLEISPDEISLLEEDRKSDLLTIRIRLGNRGEAQLIAGKLPTRVAQVELSGVGITHCKADFILGELEVKKSSYISKEKVHTLDSITNMLETFTNQPSKVDWILIQYLYAMAIPSR